MQLTLAFDDDVSPLVDMHQRLLAHFGAPEDWPRPDPVSMLILAVLGIRTFDAVTDAAFGRLLDRFGGWTRLRDAEPEAVQPLIAEVTYAEKKAVWLPQILQEITARRGTLDLDFLGTVTVDDALAWLEKLPGVGRKISASALNFSTLRMRALILSTHHLRVVRRLGLVPRTAGTAEVYKRLMQEAPDGWSADDLAIHHRLVKRLGQTACRHAEPDCPACPLLDICATGRRHETPANRSPRRGRAPTATASR